MSLSYIKPLDGIRFLAVTLVLLDHWSGDKMGFPAGYLGVCLFFVLSGFLITRILLQAKQKDDQKGVRHTASIKRFFIRRTIRIFPLYYLTLLVLFLADVPPIREKIFWLVSYSSNIYMALNATWLGSSDHLWSLAVEEQFYLFFPFLIFFLPFGRLPRLFPLLILFSVALRAYFFYTNASWIVSYVLVFTCLDAFGLGAWLAWLQRTKNERAERIFSSVYTLTGSLLAYIGLLIFEKYSQLEPHNELIVIWLRLFESIVSVSLIGYVSWGIPKNSDAFAPILEKFLLFPLFVYIGKVSYGIYIFHNFVYNTYHTPASHPTARLLHSIHQVLPWFQSSWLFSFFLFYAITLGLATLSWYAFEKPINRWKDTFTYE
jgi:peptidoglycan/LPS O-acetylase OafA/YrhL